MLSCKIGFIGTGRMGTGLIRGILRKKLVLPENIWACDKLEERLLSISKLGVKTANSVEEIVRKVDIIFIAVKPQDIDPILEKLKNTVSSSQLIISIVAGITTSYIIKRLGKKIPLVRVMPNMPALIGEGISAISPTEYVKANELRIAKEILGAVGEVIEISEELQDAVTGLSGSGPAYIFTVLEGLIEGGLKAGLNYEIASKLALQTALGAVKLAKERKESLEELKSMIISPGGTTAEGLRILQKGGIKNCLAQAVIQATQRAKELKK